MMRKKVGRVVSNVYRTFECKSFCIKFEIFYFFFNLFGRFRQEIIFCVCITSR